MNSPAGSTERLYVPPSLRYFVPVALGNGSPGEHACFEYDLVEVLRPAMVVDLGAGNAGSFSVFCQSMKDHDVDGLAYAIDLWESDKQREAEGATTWTAINNFLHNHYRGQAYLLRLSPEQALPHFADGSVTLLRIDLDRTERALGPLLDAWEPKVGPGGVVLCSGVAERPRALEELRSKHPGAVVFPDGRGLAVAVLSTSNGAHAGWLMEALAQGEHSSSKLIQFYQHARYHHALRAEILEQGDYLSRKQVEK